jgi:hypothetical protein
VCVLALEVIRLALYLIVFSDQQGYVSGVLLINF